MTEAVQGIVNAITSNDELLRIISDNVIIDRNANSIEDIGDLVAGTEEATRVLLSGTASAIAAAVVERSGLRERLQQGTINLYSNTRARITQGANSLRQRWQDRNQPPQANVANMVGGKNKKSKRRSNKSKRRRKKSRTRRKSR